MSLLSVSMENADLRGRVDLGIAEARENPQRTWLYLLLAILVIGFVVFLFRGLAGSELTSDKGSLSSTEGVKATENQSPVTNSNDLNSSDVSGLNEVPLTNLGSLETAAPQFAAMRVTESESAELSAFEMNDSQLNSIQGEAFTSIDHALQSASHFIELQRLSLPSSGNAYDAITWVLERSPNNLNAQQLLLDLQAEYQALIASSQSAQQARNYSRRLKTIELAHPNVLQLSEVIEVSSTMSMSEPESMSANSGRARMTIESATELTEEEIISNVSTLNAEGQHEKAITLLEQKIATAHKNSKVLKVALIDQQFSARNQSALILLSQDSHTESAGYAKARLLQIQSGDLRAKEYLASLPLGQMGAASQLLLAGLQRENGEYSLAFASYQALLRHDQNNGKAWLGYAVTAESLAEFQLALYAYRKVLIASSVGASFGPEVNHFVKSRVVDLASRVSTDAVGDESW